MNYKDIITSRVTIEEIVDDFPYLNETDVRACLAYAVDREKAQILVR